MPLSAPAAARLGSRAASSRQDTSHATSLSSAGAGPRALGPRRRAAGRRRDAASDAALHAWARSALHGPHRGSVRGLLRVLLRGLAEAQPHPRRTSRAGASTGSCGEEIERHLWALLQTAAEPSVARSPVQVQLGGYFAACMDEARIEALGATPLQPALTALAAVKDRQGLARWLAEQHMASSTSELLFAFGSEQDATDATQFIAGVYAGGLGLPDRDDYLDQDAKSKELREKYRAHVVKLLELLGDDSATAAAHRSAGDGHRDHARQGESHPGRAAGPVQGLPPDEGGRAREARPGIRLEDLPRGDGRPRHPGAQREPAEVPPVDERPADDAAAGRLEAVPALAPGELAGQVPVAGLRRGGLRLPGKVLYGIEVQAPRWKRCVRWVDRDLGEALGQVFVQKNFSPELKQRTLEMVKRIEQAMQADLGIPGVDVPAHADAGPGEARRDGEQHRLPRQVARLFVDPDRPGGLPGERRPVPALRDRAAARADRQAGGPRRVGA